MWVRLTITNDVLEIVRNTRIKKRYRSPEPPGLQTQPMNIFDVELDFHTEALCFNPRKFRMRKSRSLH